MKKEKNWSKIIGKTLQMIGIISATVLITAYLLYEEYEQKTPTQTTIEEYNYSKVGFIEHIEKGYTLKQNYFFIEKDFGKFYKAYQLVRKESIETIAYIIKCESLFGDSKYISFPTPNSQIEIKEDLEKHIRNLSNIDTENVLIIISNLSWD